MISTGKPNNPQHETLEVRRKAETRIACWESVFHLQRCYRGPRYKLCACFDKAKQRRESCAEGRGAAALGPARPAPPDNAANWNK
ncbi:hypothetical protein EVAR_37560_1 [Eumeta japonica]|uniref:Uncharacterized protein n=1 Tax=Eumeta variegata TaxID=151549 RepID=A0A4C1XRE8_EUMVA|nr:hypothetical protein EVAR_37560_1 [Eumeta japonica]